MATQTSNYNLVKPSATEVIDVSQLNGNMDIIDGTMASIQSGLNESVKTTSQSLSDAQKEQARTNIGAIGDGQAVQITEQTFTAAQQQQARLNIDAAGTAAVGEITTLLNGLFLKRRFSAEYDIAGAGTNGASSVGIDFGDCTIDGYSIFAIGQFNSGGQIFATSSATVQTNGHLAVSVMNAHSNAYSDRSAWIDVIYVKDGTNIVTTNS